MNLAAWNHHILMKPNIWVWKTALSKILRPQSLPTIPLPPPTYCPELNLFLGGNRCSPSPSDGPPPLPKTPAGERWLSVSHPLSSSSDIHGDFNSSIKQNSSINIRKLSWLGATLKVTLILTAQSIFHPADGHRSCMNYISQSAPSVCGNSRTDVHASLGAQCDLNLTGRRRDHRLSL